MFYALLALTILCALLLIGGTVWLLVARGQARPRTREEVVSDMLSSGADDDSGQPVAQFFRGKTAGVRVEAEMSYTEIKALIGQRRWREAAGPLMAMVGLLGLVLFGSLTIFVRMQDKLVGGLIAAFCVYMVVRIVISIVRA